MPILTRYVVAEILKIFLITLSALTLLMMVFGMVREAVDHGLGPAEIVLLMPYILPDALRYTVPATILFAVCSVYGRMAGSNEIVALKSLGISPMAVIWPGLVLACFLSLGTAWINDLAVSWGRQGVRKVVIESLEEIVYRQLRTQKLFQASDFEIIVKGVRGDVLLNPTITFRKDSQTLMLEAEEVELRSDPKNNLLSFVARNGRFSGPGVELTFHDDDFEHVIPLDSGIKDESTFPSWMPMRIIPGEIAKTEATIARLEETFASMVAYQLLTGDLMAAVGPEWNTQRAVLKHSYDHLNKLRVEPHRRWSSGFSCLCFVLIGAPMAIWRRNADFMTSFFACFLPILLIYYPLLAIGVGRAKAGDFPPSSVWLGNVIVAALGALILRKVIRY